MFSIEDNEYYLVVTKNRVVIFGPGLPEDQNGTAYINATARNSMEMAIRNAWLFALLQAKITAIPAKAHRAGNNDTCDEYGNAEGIGGHGHHSIVSIGFPD